MRGRKQGVARESPELGAVGLQKVRLRGFLEEQVIQADVFELDREMIPGVPWEGLAEAQRIVAHGHPEADDERTGHQVEVVFDLARGWDGLVLDIRDQRIARGVADGFLNRRVQRLDERVPHGIVVAPG